MSKVAADYLAREAHVLFSMVWIGALYYLICAQDGYLKEAEPTSSSGGLSQFVPRASRYMHYAALATFLTGSYMLLKRHPRWTIDVLVGSALGMLMLLNVLVINWPRQRILTAYRQQGGRGGELPARVAAAARRLAVATRTNMVLAIPTLVLMTSSAHLPHGLISTKLVAFEVSLGIAAAIELNAIFGRLGPMASARGVALTSLAVTAVLWVVVQNL